MIHLQSWMRLPAISLAGFAAFACAPPAKESKVANDIKIVRTENAPERLFEKARAFHAVGDLTRAEQYYAAALEQGYPEGKVLPHLLRVCIDASRFQVAIDYAEPVLKKNPRDHRLRIVVASLYSAIGHFNKARQHYESAIDEEPNDPTARYALAVLLRDEFHDVVGADKQFREYLRIAPAGPHAEEAKGALLKDVTSTKAASAPAPANAPAVAPPTAAPAPPATPGKTPAKPTKIP